MMETQKRPEWKRSGDVWKVRCPQCGNEFNVAAEIVVRDHGGICWTCMDRVDFYPDPMESIVQIKIPKNIAKDSKGANQSSCPKPWEGD